MSIFLVLTTALFLECWTRDRTGTILTDKADNPKLKNKFEWREGSIIVLGTSTIVSAADGAKNKPRCRAPNHIHQLGRSIFIFSVTFDYMPQLYKTETVPMSQRDCSGEPVVQDILVSINVRRTRRGKGNKYIKI